MTVAFELEVLEAVREDGHRYSETVFVLSSSLDEAVTTYRELTSGFNPLATRLVNAYAVTLVDFVSDMLKRNLRYYLDPKISLTVSLAIGDVVRWSTVNKKLIPTTNDLFVTDVSVCQGQLQYGVSGSAWYGPEDVELVRRADKASLAAALKLLADENGDSFDEFDDEGEDG